MFAEELFDINISILTYHLPAVNMWILHEESFGPDPFFITVEFSWSVCPPSIQPGTSTAVAKTHALSSNLQQSSTSFI